MRKFNKFTYNDKEIEVVPEYTYLGVVMNYNNKFSKAIVNQITLAKKATFALNSKILYLNLPLDLQIELYNKLIIPVLTYGCEVWGFENLEQIEILQRKFLKNALRVNKFVANAMTYGETGQMKVEITIYTRMISFWHRLRSGHNSKISKMLFNLTKKMFDENIYKLKWLQKIETILNSTGLSYLWNFDGIAITYLKTYVKKRLQDASIQDWGREIQENRLCLNYRLFKVNFGLEYYLTKLDFDLRINISKFRTGSHNLPISDKRYEPPNDRSLCPLCHSDIGDEYHYVMICTGLNHIRSKFIPQEFIIRPNTLKFQRLFSSKSISTLTKLSKFLKMIMHIFRQ